MNAQAPRGGRAFPVEEFVQSLSAQLDRAQDGLALKVRTGRPLTFAIKDLSIDLRVFWESDSAGRVLVRHAGPNEEGASTVHLNFTTITKEMVEENTFSLGMDEDPRGLQDLPGDAGFSEQDRRRLEMIGVRTVGQLRRLSAETDPKSVETFAGVPMLRLQAALLQAARPSVTTVEPVRRDGRQLLRVRGANLDFGDALEVRLSGEPVEVLEATATSLLVRPMSHHRDGRVEVSVGGAMATGFYDLPPDFRAPAELRDPGAAVRHAGETMAVPRIAVPAANGADHG
ncbi:MAG: IPT/TIG domain-containing protein [Longimicrobiaceae bacterium]